jgi:hypothetical protein
MMNDWGDTSKCDENINKSDCTHCTVRQAAFLVMKSCSCLASAFLKCRAHQGPPNFKLNYARHAVQVL